MLISLLMQRDHAPRHHGNGFVQLPLTPTRRLHVWHPGLPPIPDHNATIHNHVWDLQSRILLGCLLHVTYSLDMEEIETTHDVWRLGEERPDIPEGDARVIVTGEYNMTAGSIYIFPEGQWHESHMSYPDTMTATLMEKRAARPDARPLVACPRGQPPVDAFAPEHQPSVGTMWDAIGEAIMAMTPESRSEIEACLS